MQGSGHQELGGSRLGGGISSADLFAVSSQRCVEVCWMQRMVLLLCMALSALAALWYCTVELRAVQTKCSACLMWQNRSSYSSPGDVHISCLSGEMEVSCLNALWSHSSWHYRELVPNPTNTTINTKYLHKSPMSQEAQALVPCSLMSRSSCTSRPGWGG